MEKDEADVKVEDTVTRESEDELSEEQLSDVAGGSVSFSYSQVAVTYTPQK